MITILFMGSKEAEEGYENELKKIITNLDFRVYPQIGDNRDIEYILVKKPTIADFTVFSNLKAIISLTVGLDQFIDLKISSKTPVFRMLDEGHKISMSEFILHSVFYYHRRIFNYDLQQQNKIWEEHPLIPSRNRKVGFMGFGEMAKMPAYILRDLGFNLSCWSKTFKNISGITSFYGKEELNVFLHDLDILVCLLPLTKETENILNFSTMSILPKGASIINVGRGRCLNENDLVCLLNENHLIGATLDVFQKEPLDKESPLWKHPKIKITPHIASKADYLKAAEFIKTKIGKNTVT